MTDKKNYNLKSSVKYLALLLIILFFSGVFQNGPEFLRAFDYNTLLGKFGTIGDTNSNFVGKGDISVRQGFLFALSIIPGIMLALGAVSVAAYFGALDAARVLLTPLLKPLLGIRGQSGLALIGSLQSSDAGAAMTRELCDKDLITPKERNIFTAFQFSSASSITVYLSAIPAVSSYLEVPLLMPLMLIIVIKVFGANLMRVLMHFRKQEKYLLCADSLSLAKVKEEPVDRSATQAFINGARRAFNIGIMHLMPNIVMAYLITEMLSLCGALDLIGSVCAPVMGIFSLPGEALTVLITAWMSGLGGVAVAASLYSHGSLSAHDLTILIPAVFLMGGQLQYMGRILAVIGIPSVLYKYLFSISIVNAFISMLIMRMYLHN